MDARRIATDRLVLVSATAQHLLVERQERGKLGGLVAAEVPDAWPPPGSDDATLAEILDRLQTNPAGIGWWRRYVVLRKGPQGRPVLVGHAGFAGPADADGRVRLVHGFVPGLADADVMREALGALVDFAMGDEGVTRVDADAAEPGSELDAVLDRLGLPEADGDGARTLPRERWETSGPCLPRRLVPRPPDAPIEGIPAVARATFERLLQERVRDAPDMRREVALYLEVIEQAAQTEEHVDIELARAIARTCDELLAAIGDGTPEHTRRQIQAAARYFVLEDDGDSDLVIGGLDEDAAVANAVASHLGRRDLVAELP